MSGPIQRIEGTPRYSAAVVSGGAVFLSGQIPDDSGAGFDHQVTQVFARIDSLLARSGSSRSLMAHALVHLASLDLIPHFNALWEQWIDAQAKPARTIAVAATASPGCLVEITVTAFT